MEKRHQIFVSSTYIDLKEERLEVMRALLELDCIPSGMEYFPATNDDQWSFIKDLINQCDYYIVVVGARYGSVSNDGLSYTEKEYRYALEKGIPIAGFLHADPGNIPQKNGEADPSRRVKLDEFRSLVQQKLCKTWSTQAELGAVVSRSVTQLIKRNPRPGWVRADQLASSEASLEILRLRQLLDKKDEELKNLLDQQVSVNEKLAHGQDKVELSYVIALTDPNRGYNDLERTLRYSVSKVLTWDEIFKIVGPELLTPTKASTIRTALSRQLKGLESGQSALYSPDRYISAVSIPSSAINVLMVQFVALGYMELTNIEDRDGNLVKMASLSKKGKEYLTSINAVSRGIVATTMMDRPQNELDSIA